jgi:hypothetical protein
MARLMLQLLAMSPDTVFTQKRAHLTVSDRDILNGVWCDCTACHRDGQHEPECAVHDEPRSECSCGRTEQTQGPG